MRGLSLQLLDVPIAVRPTMSITTVVRRLSYALPFVAISGLGAQTQLDTLKTNAPAPTAGRSPKLEAFEARRAALRGKGHFLADEDLRKYDNASLGVTLKRLSGIRIVTGNSALYAVSSQGVSQNSGGSFTGGGRGDQSRNRTCYVSIYEDGTATYTGNEQLPDLSQMPTKNYGGVEYYSPTSSLPSELSSVKPSRCGVLLLWTR